MANKKEYKKSEPEKSETTENEEAKAAAQDNNQEKAESLEKEAKEYYDRLLRVSAEFENYKKRNEREVSEFRKYANESLLKALLPAVDNLERAIASGLEKEKENTGMIAGLNLTLAEILKVFERFGVFPIDAMGESFDPNFHQAVMQEETDDHPANTVINELQKGYKYHDRLLRPSMAVVSKEKADADKEKEDTSQQDA
ncbi:MAG: nucleotide exchange factor GrpE [Desulfobacterales bacterium]|nr:nucleotide exchange factor GrpE [Desulfobacterales bacterium]